VAVAEAVGARPGDPRPAGLAAAVAGVDRLVHAEIRRRMLAGARPERVRAAARRQVARAFDLLDADLAGYG
jgi:hypothetical protein